MGNKSAFVTGGSGFLGSALIRKLRFDNWTVRALVHRDSTELEGNGVALVKSDVLDVTGLANAMEGCNALFHLAGIVSFNPKDRSRLLSVNVEGTRNVLRAASVAGVARAVVTSSAITLGTTQGSEIVDESARCRPEWRMDNPYLDSKATQEEVAAAAGTPDLKVMIVNPVTVFGPGDRRLNSGTMIKMINDSKVIVLPPGGTSVVDVRDVASGLIAALERGESGRRYVLASEHLTFYDLYSTIAKVLDKRPYFLRLPRYSRSILSLGALIYGYGAKLKGRKETLITPSIVRSTFGFKYYSSERARKELGWNAGYSIEQSVEQAVDYYSREGLL